METEKRIGHFRVNRKVAWVMCFPQPLHSPTSDQKALLRGFRAGFLHSIGVEVNTPPAQPLDAVRKAGDGRRVLVAKPAVGDRARPSQALGFVEGVVAFDDDLLDLAQQAGLDEIVEVLAGHPGQEALQPSRGGYVWVSGRVGPSPAASSKTLVRSVQMKGRLRYSSR